MLIFAQSDHTGINETKSSRQCQTYRTMFQSVSRSFLQKMAGTIINQGDKNIFKKSGTCFSLMGETAFLSSLDHTATTFWVIFLTLHAQEKKYHHIQFRKISRNIFK